MILTAKVSLPRISGDPAKIVSMTRPVFVPGSATVNIAGKLQPAIVLTTKIIADIVA
jgi:hypothetical protein